MKPRRSIGRERFRLRPNKIGRFRPRASDRPGPASVRVDRFLAVVEIGSTGLLDGRATISSGASMTQTRVAAVAAAFLSTIAFVAGYARGPSPVSNPVEHRGCCSHHRGVCGCSSGERAKCCDGTLSPTCECD
jgi:hypothetical protein